MYGLLVTLLIAVTSYVVHMCIHHPFKPIKYCVYMTCMPNFEGIFASGTSLVITCEVCIVVSCVLVHVYKNVGSIYAAG